MLPFFTTPKPFTGHIAVIQRNALRSWQCLHPGVEVLLLGDEPGAAEVCHELGIRDIPEVRRNRHGRTRLWHPLLDKTRSLRHSIGLRNEALALLCHCRNVRRHWQDQ